MYYRKQLLKVSWIKKRRYKHLQTLMILQAHSRLLMKLTKDGHTLPVLTERLFPTSLAIKKGMLWSQIHMFYVLIRGFPVNKFNKSRAYKILNSTEHYPPTSLAHTTPLQKTRKKWLHWAALFLEGVQLPWDSYPISAKLKVLRQIALQHLPLASSSELTWLLGQDEIKDTGSGMESVVASPTSKCARFCSSLW